MKIEVSPQEYWKELNYDDAILYCKLLEIDGKSDWRMPTKDEGGNTPINTWVVGDNKSHQIEKYGQFIFRIVPIRDN